MIRMLCAALAALLFCAPASAAEWVLGFTANLQGTSYSFPCDDSRPECMVETISPVSGTFSRMIWTEEFLGTKTFDGEFGAGPLGGVQGVYSGTMSFDGSRLIGTNFYYSEGGTADTQLHWFTAAAPEFSLYTIPGFPGPVPEPGTWALLILGFLCVGCVVRSRAIHSGTPTPQRA